MGFSDDDFFGGGIEELFNRLAQEGFIEDNAPDSQGRKKFLKRGKRNIFGKVFLNKVISSKKVYLIFDLSDRKDVTATLKENNSSQLGDKVLEVRDKEDVLFEFPLDEINTKNFESKFNNGLLEVSFKK